MAKKLSAKQVAQDIKSGMSREDLKLKYDLTDKGVDGLFKKLKQMGMLEDPAVKPVVPSAGEESSANQRRSALGANTRKPGLLARVKSLLGPKKVGFRGTLRVCRKHKVVGLYTPIAFYEIAGDSAQCGDSCKLVPATEAQAMSVLGWSEEKLAQEVYGLLTGINPDFFPKARDIREDCAKRLGWTSEKLKQDLPTFEERSGIEYPEAASHLLLDHATLSMPTMTPEQIHAEYERIKGAWGCKVLVVGTKREVRPRLRAHFDRMAKSQGFQGFSISVDPEKGFAQVNSSFPKEFFGLRLWQSKDKLFVCSSDPNLK